MKNVAILAAGQFPRKEYPRYLLDSADVIVCCDGALQIAEKHGIVPDVVIGDLDSVCGRALGRFTSGTMEGERRDKSMRVAIKDEDQDTNDLTKAFDYVMKNFAGRPGPDLSVSILGATGKSEAHTIGNVSLLMEYARRYDLDGIDVQMVSDYSTIFALRDSQRLHVGAGRKVSVFSADPTLCIKSEGLQWPLDSVVFDNWWKATLNRASDDVIALTFSHPGPVVVILD